MDAGQQLQRCARDLENQIRALHLHTSATRRPWVPGRAPAVEVDTRYLWAAWSALQRALARLIHDTRRTDMAKPLTFGQVDRTPEEAANNGTVSFEHLRQFGVLQKAYQDAGCTKPVWKVLVDCEINGAWYQPGEEIPW